MRTATAELKEPAACTENERGAFGRLVREAFNGSDESLPGRIRDAKLLAFCYPDGRALGAIAALKAPGAARREGVFEKAGAQVAEANYAAELGWVYVAPDHRGHRIAERLCRLLLAHVPASGVFATTRTDNAAMMRILVDLGFVRTGRPFPRRNDDLVLFLRPGRAKSRPTGNH